MALLTIARAMLTETLRKRMLFAMLLITVLLIGLTSWGYRSLVRMDIAHGEMILAASQQLVLVMFVFTGILGLTAILVAAGSLSGEIESGVMLAVLGRPLHRRDVVLGKWLGMAVLTVCYTSALTLLEFLVVFNIAGYQPPHPVSAWAAITLESLALATVGLMLSTRLSAMTAGVLSAAGFFMAWLGGVAGGLGAAFHSTTLVNIGVISSLMLPTDGLWRAAIYNLEPAGVMALVGGTHAAANPFTVTAPPTDAYLVWIGVWFVLAVTISVLLFTRRDF